MVNNAYFLGYWLLVVVDNCLKSCCDAPDAFVECERGSEQFAIQCCYRVDITSIKIKFNFAVASSDPTTIPTMIVPMSYDAYRPRTA